MEENAAAMDLSLACVQTGCKACARLFLLSLLFVEQGTREFRGTAFFPPEQQDTGQRLQATLL